MNTEAKLKRILRDVLQLGDRAESLNSGSGLLGSLPEFDSMSVVTVVAMIEDEFGVTVADDELSADVFATLGALEKFVAEKTRT